MSKIAKAFIAAIAATAVSGFAVLADTNATSTDDAKQTPAASVTTGSINNDPPFAQRMQDCMAIWDKGTHMTKGQWRRSCRTTLQSLAD